MYTGNVELGIIAVEQPGNSWEFKNDQEENLGTKS